jgi:hypothetical protein
LDRELLDRAADDRHRGADRAPGDVQAAAVRHQQMQFLITSPLTSAITARVSRSAAEARG